MRPEKAARASKRRRTTEVLGSPSSHEHETPTVTPRRMQKICEMGFTPTTTTIALRQHNGDVTRTVEWLLNNPTSEDELAAMSQPPKKKKRTTAGKGIMPSDKAQELGLDMAAGDQAQDILEVHNSAELPDPSEITKSPNVQVVIPAKSPKNHTSPDHNKVLRRSSQQQTKRRKTSSNIQDDTSGIQNNQKASLSIIQEPIKEKKRGRGRPKKAESTTVTTHEPTITTEDIITPTHREILHETEPNDKIPVMDSINDYDSIKEGGSQQEVAPIKPPYPPSPKPPSASENTTNAKSTKQPSCSPATTGKVPHRVGLSKRARIAPLLKITSKK